MTSEERLASWGQDGADWSVLVHGGAGTLGGRDAERHVQGCRVAAEAAASILRLGGSALDAVERAVVVLEDDPCFNAGTGAALNAEGDLELDASLMEGSGLRAGAVCALPPFLHPIAIARAVLDEGGHVLYAAGGAARFAIEHGFTSSSAAAMITPEARARWEAARAGTVSNVGPGGTVGAVARDSRGSVAAATSTGGLANKRAGRVGDSPLLGAGTYADDDGGACSFTGIGEAAMRLERAKGASDAMRGRIPQEDAARASIDQLARRVAGIGGLILVDRSGRLGWARNASAMTWAAMANGRLGAAGM